MNAKPRLLKKFAIGIVVLPLIGCGIFYASFLRIYAAPSPAVVPALAQDERVVFERFSYFLSHPAGGDVIGFNSKAIPALPAGYPINIKRVVGIPGEHIQLEQGHLYVDGVEVLLSNRVGRLTYPSHRGFPREQFTNMTLGARQYFVLGDNGTNSFDGRYWLRAKVSYSGPCLGR